MAIAGAFAVGSGPNRLFRGFLWVAAAGVSLVGIRDLLAGYPPLVDIEVPLRAAERWLAGGQPYLASAFEAPPGYDVPFLYPPFVLPFLAPLTFLPREVVFVAWLAVCVATALWIVRRLGVPWPVAPFLLLWPPFAEAIFGGNVQLLLVGAFVAVFFGRPARPWTPATRDPAIADRPAVIDGVLGAAIPAFKISQPHAWVALLRRRPRAALAGLGCVGALAVATVPLVGLDAWLAWVEQLRRAADPAWPLAGASLTAGLPAVVGLTVAAATALACLVVPLARLGAWTGILTVVGAPSLRMFGVLFALPAMLTVRREAALIAAALIASYTLEGLWLGLVVVLGTLLAAERYPALREPNGP
ncbi:MAG TPA: glycosyltransferase family 87 protein [Candidatus Nanopelagicales bacterium]|nr:glycosyltransferase family 87 protein [Candidatus Nanopelagicales bacterium]